MGLNAINIHLNKLKYILHAKSSEDALSFLKFIIAIPYTTKEFLISENIQLCSIVNLLKVIAVNFINILLQLSLDYVSFHLHGRQLANELQRQICLTTCIEMYELNKQVFN